MEDLVVGSTLRIFIESRGRVGGRVLPDTRIVFESGDLSVLLMYLTELGISFNALDRRGWKTIETECVWFNAEILLPTYRFGSIKCKFDRMSTWPLTAALAPVYTFTSVDGAPQAGYFLSDSVVRPVPDPRYTVTRG